MDIKFVLDENNISTFANPGWRLLTVPEGNKLSLTESADFEFDFSVDQNLISSKTGIVKKTLEDIQNNCKNCKILFQFRLQERQKKEYTYEQLDQEEKYNKVMKCKIPQQLHEYLMPIFVASVVNYKDILREVGSEKSVIKKNFTNVVSNFINESFTLRMDSQNAVLVDVEYFEDENNPFLEYARNSIRNTSLENVVGRDIFKELKSTDENDKLENFYDYSTVKDWRPVEELKDIGVGDCRNVIYMLYDENNESFYVGKAEDLKSRLVAHQMKEDDPIPNFTHFRYTILNEQYAQYILFIENAAIHDCAAILNMQKRKKLKMSLQEHIKAGSIGGDIHEVVMVNDMEHQTHETKKKK